MRRLCLSLLAALPAPAAAQAFRAVLLSPGGELPFGLELHQSRAVVVNGDERIDLPAPRWRGDEVTLLLPPYDARIVATRGRDGALQGCWTKAGPRGDVSLPLRAVPGEAPRFPLAGEPDAIAQRYRVAFAGDGEPAVAILARAADGTLSGTFLTTTGDHRFLAGDARGGELRLSCFDGAHAFLFAARLRDDGSLAGDFWSGPAHHQTWTATPDPQAALPDAFTLTKARAGVNLGALVYPTPEGEPRRLDDFFGRATLVVLLGTWCPNCGDAGPVLAALEQEHGFDGLTVVGLAFEHGDDRARHARVVREYRERRGIDFPILVAGPSDKAAASAAFPAIDAVRAYPTILFVDGEGAVRSVYTGFCGPATGAAFRAQQQQFERLVQDLLDGDR